MFLNKEPGVLSNALSIKSSTPLWCWHWAWAYRLLKFLKYCVVVYNWLSLVLDVQCCGNVFESLLISLCLTIKIKNTCSALLKYLMYKAAADWEPKFSFLSSSPLATDFKSLSLFSLFLLVTGSTEGPDAFQVLCHFFAGFCSVSQGHEFALDGFLHLPTCATSWKKNVSENGHLQGLDRKWLKPNQKHCKTFRGAGEQLLKTFSASAD